MSTSGQANPAAFAAGQLAENLAAGYYAHSAAITIAKDPRAPALMPPILPGYAVPVGRVARKDGTEHVFSFPHYLESARTNPAIASELPRVWLSGSLLTLGDALGQQQYFDHAPELEFIRHLRNGIAHGNRFNIDKRGREQLAKYPAHNRLAAIRGDNQELFEITPALNGQPVLFDYMGPANVLDVLLSAGMYLIRMGNGDPLRG